MLIKGYSWHTNQYGLSIDTVTAFELVKPDGSVSTVTQASDSQLFFGLKVRLYKSLFQVQVIHWHHVYIRAASTTLELSPSSP